MVSIENLVHNDCFDYFCCIHFLSTIYSEYLIDYLYNSYLIYYSQVIQVITLKLLFLVVDIFGYFYLIQAHLHSYILNLLSILTRCKLLAICIVMSIFLLFQLCVYYVAFCNSFTFVFVLQNKVQNVDYRWSSLSTFYCSWKPKRLRRYKGWLSNFH